MSNSTEILVAYFFTSVKVLNKTGLTVAMHFLLVLNETLCCSSMYI